MILIENIPVGIASDHAGFVLKEEADINEGLKR